MDVLSHLCECLCFVFSLKFLEWSSKDRELYWGGGGGSITQMGRKSKRKRSQQQQQAPPQDLGKPPAPKRQDVGQVHQESESPAPTDFEDNKSTCIQEAGDSNWPEEITLTKEEFKCIQEVSALFADLDGHEIAKQGKQELRDQGIFLSSLTYGEVNLEAFAAILRIVAPKEGEIFYDIGSGTGKVNFIILISRCSACFELNYREIKLLVCRQCFWQLICTPIHLPNAVASSWSLPSTKRLLLSATSMQNREGW